MHVSQVHFKLITNIKFTAASRLERCTKIFRFLQQLYKLKRKIRIHTSAEVDRGLLQVFYLFEIHHESVLIFVIVHPGTKLFRHALSS